MKPILNTNPSVKLGDILTGEQIEKTITLMNSGIPESEVYRRLRELYELDGKGWSRPARCRNTWLTPSPSI